MPKKVLTESHKYRAYLWTGVDSSSKKALVFGILSVPLRFVVIWTPKIYSPRIRMQFLSSVGLYLENKTGCGLTGCMLITSSIMMCTRCPPPPKKNMILTGFQEDFWNKGASYWTYFVLIGTSLLSISISIRKVMQRKFLGEELSVIAKQLLKLFYCLVVFSWQS